MILYIVRSAMRVSLAGVTLLALVLSPIAAQAAPAVQDDQTIGYGETVSGILLPNSPTHAWVFDGQARDIVQITVQRISGQVVPRVILVGPGGAALVPTSDVSDPYAQTVEFFGGLPDDGAYTIQVSGEPVREDVDNPDEYSLTLIRLGARHADRYRDLDIPALGLDSTLPYPLEGGTPDAANDERSMLGMAFYGAGQVRRPDPGGRPADFNLRGGGYTIETLYNGNVLSRLVRSLSFVAGGIGFTTQQGSVFFTDQNITRLENDYSTITITLANGQQIITDYVQIESIQAVQNLVVIRTLSGQRAVLSGQFFDIRQQDQRSVFSVDQAVRLETDLSGWDTLAYLPDHNTPPLSLLFGPDVRILSDEGHLTILARAEVPNVYDMTLAYGDEQTLVMEFDTFGMGDLVIARGDLAVRPLDGRDLHEPLNNVRHLLIENRAVRFGRIDGRFRLSLPDQTEIETPARLPDNLSALPHQPGYVPRGHNNLGADLLPTYPAVNRAQEQSPVNPANGNFYYTVRDFYVPSHTLELDWTRHYNSEGPALTPAYMLNSAAVYPLAQLGQGWRHSYQYELDLTFAPLGQVTLIWPNGTQHIFEESDPARRRFRSDTLRMWTLERLSGATGTWRLTRTDGQRILFDRAGRLASLQDRNDLALTFSPVPRAYLKDGDAGGFFVVEPYGRRFEVYADTTNHITHARDVSRLDIPYGYESGNLISVVYPLPDSRATYTYQVDLLVDLVDARSSGAPHIQITYDGSGRVQQIAEDPDHAGRRATYTYDGTVTRRSATVSGVERISQWTMDPEGRIARYDTPGAAQEEEWHYEYIYSNTWPAYMDDYRLPGGNRIRFDYNDWGHLTLINDPIYSNTEQTIFDYAERDDGRQLVLDEITYGSAGYDRFEYDERGRVTRWIQLVSQYPTTTEYITRYEYDAWGRVIARYQPGPDGAEVITTFQYDAFGYVKQVSEGGGARVWAFSHDRAGLLRAVSDGRGQTTTINWNETGDKITSITDPLGHETAYVYDGVGNLRRVDDRGAVTEYGYDGLRQVITMTDPAGGVTNYQYDEAGNTIRVTLPKDQLVYAYTYDALDHLVRSERPDGLATTYETIIERGAGEALSGYLLHRIVDPAGQTTEYTYDSLGRVTQVIQRDPTGRTAYEYDVAYQGRHRLTQMQRMSGPATLTTRLEYDLSGRPIRTTVANLITTYSYDPAGNLAAVQMAGGRTVRYTYDVLGNVTSVTLPGSDQWPAPTYSYTYDENGNRVSATDPEGRVTTYVYDDLNRLQTAIDPLQRETSYTYDARGNLVGVTYPEDNTQQAEYNPSDRLISTTDGLGSKSAYTYDEVGRLTLFEAPFRSFYTGYTYDVNNNVVAVSYPGERKDLYNYDVVGRVLSVTDALGHTSVYGYNALGEISRITDPLGNTQEFLWNGAGRLAFYVSPSGHRYEYVSDELGRLSQITDRGAEYDSIFTYLTYDEAGQISDIEFANSQTRYGDFSIHHQYAYTPQGWLQSYIDPLGGTWTFTYDRAGQLTGFTNPAGSATVYTYDAAGQITSVVRANGTAVAQTELFEYDRNGNVARYTAPDGLISAFTYDENNRLTRRVVGVGTGAEREYFYEYDPLGHLSAITDPAGQVTRFKYDEMGHVLEMTRSLIGADGQAAAVSYRYRYDKAGNLTALILPEGQGLTDTVPGEDYQVNLTYNALDLRVHYIDAEDKVWTYTYDADRRLTQISDPLGSVTRYEYDSQGRVARVIYPNNAVVAVAYDGAGNLNKVIGADTEVRTFTNEAETITPTPVTITYRLDRMGNLLAIEDIDASRTLFTYDRLGNLTSRAAPNGATISYSYDALGRMIQRSSPDSYWSYQYDAGGRLESVTDGGSSTYAFTYDEFGQTRTATAPWLTTTYTRDTVGNVIERDAGALGVARYTYDSLYRLTRVELGDRFINFTYDKNGWVQTIERSNGVITYYTYDTNGRPIGVVHLGADNQRLDRWTYAYDDVGNIASITRQDDWYIQFSYDAAHQVISERWLDPSSQTQYAASIRYDEAGNRIEVQVSRVGQNPSHTLYVYDRENQLVLEIRDYVPPELAFDPVIPAALLVIGTGWAWRRGRALRGLLVMAQIVGLLLIAWPALAQDEAGYRIAYEYDANGNLTRIIHPPENGSVLNFTYSADNRLTGVSGVTETGETINTRLVYDPFNRLVRWETQDLQRRFLYDGRALIGQEDLINGEREVYVEPFPGQRLLTIRADGTAVWPLHDALNSTRRLTDDQGQLTDALITGFDYNAFGDLITPYETETPNPLPTAPAPMFAGQMFEPTSGLYLMGWRAYDAGAGRFIQRDPIRHDLQGTLYTYAYNRPGVFRDPQGTTPEAVLDATRLVSLPDDLMPDAIPQPLAPDIVYPPTMQTLQSQEAYRGVRVIREAWSGLNDVTSLLDPLLRDFYVYQAHPVPEMALRMSSPASAIAEQRALSPGWAALLPPDPHAHAAPVERLQTVEPLLWQSRASAFDWYTSDPAAYLPIPSAARPDPSGGAIRLETAWLDTLRETLLMGGVIPTMGDLRQQVGPAIIAPPVPQLALPQPEVTPPVLQHIEALRARQRQFYTQNRLLGGALP